MSDAAIGARWSRLRAERRTALIPYLTAGYPDREESLRAVAMLAEAGADFIELGIPFSDPVADGPVIQRSSQLALERGMSVGGALELVREAAPPVPVIVFGYLNPILAYGLDRFLDDAAGAGVSGLLLTDLPAGEDPALEQAVLQSGLSLIRLVAPTTEEARLQELLRAAEGFVYVISRLGVTGASTDIDSQVEELVARVRRATALPDRARTGAEQPWLGPSGGAYNKSQTDHRENRPCAIASSFLSFTSFSRSFSALLC